MSGKNMDKNKKVDELIIANKENALELATANKEVAFQNDQKGKQVEKLITANKENALELITAANKELVIQNEEKEKRAAELSIVNKELMAFTYVSSHDLQGTIA